MNIWAQTLVKNEERYIWYALMSVVDYIDKILVWDTGSTDNTVSIIKEVSKARPGKIDFKEVGKVNIEEFTAVRQQMLQATKSDWMMILDGDEVWWNDSIRRHVEFIHNKGSKYESLVTPYINAIGDMYHYQDEKAGKYSIDGRMGNLTIRFNSLKIPGLSFLKPHGQQGLYDVDGNVIQNRSKEKRMFIDANFLHLTYLPRSQDRTQDLKVPKRNLKYKHELGIPFKLDYFYPEVFFQPYPAIVSNPWFNRSWKYKYVSLIQKPFKYIKRRAIKNAKSGY